MAVISVTTSFLPMRETFDRQLANGKRKAFVIICERNGGSILAAFKGNSQAISSSRLMHEGTQIGTGLRCMSWGIMP